MKTKKIQVETIKLEGFFPSEFTPERNFDEIFNKHGFMMGRMISGSKSLYRSKYPEHEVYFNANIVIESAKKVWYGDIDFHFDSVKLQEICNELKEPVYILREMDGRFENENQPIEFYKKNAVKIFNPQ